MKILNVFASIFMAICIFTVCVFLPEKKENESTDAKSIITLWHIDSFEGGIGSRKQFLQNNCYKFCKDKNFIIMCISHTETSATELFEKGEFPDMISYGSGFEIKNLLSFKCDKTFEAGKVGNSLFAIPWCRGGYFLIKNQKQNNGEYLVSTWDRGVPLLAIESGNAKINEKNQIDAYNAFLSGAYTYLIGTQRDVYRLSKKQFDLEHFPLGKFCDLYQYISIIKNKAICESFIDYLVSENVQKSLNNIGMFSCYYNVEFEIDALNLMQKTEIENFMPNFYNYKNLSVLREDALKIYKGEKDFSILKNILL